ncbi:MAG: hypothetical protein NZ742_04740 [Acidobacteria bacterium]|nr:hypothetical protein [Acidobacteriota bacterium]MDW7984196.1 hypothetical protein [Acidobacteriota bacterium]
MERVGSYVLVQPIYRWGWADVFLAVEAPEGRTRRVVWWARLSPDLPWEEARFVHRLQDLLSTFRRQIQDPILTLPTQWDFTTASPFMVFEPISGKSLWEVLQAGRDQLLPISIDQALTCTHQLLMALQTLHDLMFQDQPAFHGSLSPTQVFVTYEGQLRLVYSGILQALGETGRIPSSIRQALGPYLAPEQRDGWPGSQATDVYTASLLCLELLTNRPWEAPPADPAAWLMDQTVYLRTGEVVHFPEDLQMVFLQGLQADPHQRFQQISLLKEPLDEKAFSGEYEASTFHLAFYLNALFRDFPEREHRHYQSLLEQDYSDLFATPPLPPAESPAGPSEPSPAPSPEEVVLYPQVMLSEERPRRGFPLLPVLIALVILAFGGGAIWLLQRRMTVVPPTVTPETSPETIALRQQLEENQRRITELQQIIQQLQAAQSTQPAAGPAADAADAQMQELLKRVQELAQQNEELQRQLREKEKTTTSLSALPAPTRTPKEAPPESRSAEEPSPAPLTLEKTPSAVASPVLPSPVDATAKSETGPTPPPSAPGMEVPSSAAPSPPPAKVEPELPPRAEPSPTSLPEFALEVDLDVRIEPVGPCVSTDPRLSWIRSRYPGTHRVIGQIYLNESGQPLQVEILQAPVDLLREIARDTWMNCRFRRPTRNGQPVKAVITRVLVFGK